MSTFDDASLVFIPSGYKTSKAYSVKPTDGSGDLAFTRSNDTATRVGPDGLIEKVRTNLITYSEDLSNAAYTNDPTDGSVTITANYGVAPDGTNTADRVQITKGTSYSQIYQAKSVTAGIEYSFSLYLKSLSGTPTITFLYNENGAVGKATLTSSWVRYTLTYNAPLTSTNYPMIALYAGDSASCDILAWGLQFETGVPTDYIATTAAVSVGPVANVPRLDYLNSTCPRLLLEPQRTNRLPMSEQITNATFWNFLGGNLVAAANVAISPDGTQNADSITLSNTANRYYVSDAINITAGTVVTYSVYMKSTSGTLTIGMGLVNGATAIQKTVTTEWQRFFVTFTMHAGGAEYFGIEQRGAGASTSGTLLFWGAQVEEAAYATSYIPTLGAAVTRGADIASKTGISSLIGQTEGVLFLDFVLKNSASTVNRVISLTEPNWLSGGSIRLDVTSTSFVADIVESNATSAGITYNIAVTENTRYKVAIAYKLNDVKMYVNGIDAGSDTSTIAMPTCSEIYINELGGTFPTVLQAAAFSQVLLFKTRLTNAQLAELTTI